RIVAEKRGWVAPEAAASGDRTPPARAPYFAPLEPFRVRAADFARMRSIWPRGRVTQISPIHSSFTPLIGLALKLVRLTELGVLPRSIVFRYVVHGVLVTAASA